MIPHFTDRHQYCERCETVIFIGYECVLHQDGYFCTEDCLKDHLYDMSQAQEVYLTTDKLHKEGM